MNSTGGRHPGLADPVKDATVSALERVLDPLLELLFDAGVTVQELNQIARNRAVRIATKRVIKESGRESKSRVAIMTGLPRSEVTRILGSSDSVPNPKPDQHPARRVLAAWHDDPRFLASNGDPEVLPIFGRRRSFERLVERYGASIPVRAMLDELVQLDAVERLEDQKVRAKSRVPIMTGLTNRSITAVGERGKDLLETLAHNVRRSTQPYFEATAVIDDGDLELVNFLRREIAEQGTNFINSATSLLNRSQIKRSSKTAKSSRTVRLGVTVYYFQEEPPNDAEAIGVGTHGRRKNLRRQPGKPPKAESK
jgi:Family of unknown function (DUF6502)